MRSHAYRSTWYTALLLACWAVSASSSAAVSAQTLKAVKDRGTLICGVSEGLYGFSAPDEKGGWSGFGLIGARNSEAIQRSEQG